MDPTLPEGLVLPHVVEPGQERTAAHFNENWAAIAWWLHDLVKKELGRLPESPGPLKGAEGDTRSRGDQERYYVVPASGRDGFDIRDRKDGSTFAFRDNRTDANIVAEKKNGNGRSDCEWCHGDPELCDGNECEK